MPSARLRARWSSIPSSCQRSSVSHDRFSAPDGAEEAKAHLERFQRLTTEKIASAMSLGYGDQGPLSLAEALVPKDGAPPPAVPVKFVAQAPDAFAAAVGAAGTGNGVSTGGCLFDADGDGVNDYLALNPRSEPGKPDDAAVLFRGAAGGTFERAAQTGLTDGVPAARVCGGRLRQR